MLDAEGMLHSGYVAKILRSQLLVCSIFTTFKRLGFLIVCIHISKGSLFLFDNK